MALTWAEVRIGATPSPRQASDRFTRTTYVVVIAAKDAIALEGVAICLAERHSLLLGQNAAAVAPSRA